MAVRTQATAPPRVRQAGDPQGAKPERLLEGKDEIDLILNHESDIAAYERDRAGELAWRLN